MTAKRLLESNGDFRNSPLLTTVHHMNELLSVMGCRTTADVNILTTREGWAEVGKSLPEGFKIEMDSGFSKEAW